MTKDEIILECIRIYLKRIADALEKIAEKTETIEEPKEQFNIDDVSLDYVNLRSQTRNALLRKGIKTVGEVRQLSVKQLLSIRSIGPEAVADIITMLEEYGIELPKYAKGAKE